MNIGSMRALEQSTVRHLTMRLGLGFVLTWFGAQELHNPTDWTVFIPSIVTDLSPVASNQLIVAHGFLLLVAAASVVLGLLYRPGCVLASGVLLSIVGGLWLDNGVDDLVVRDLGLLALAVALTVDSARRWQLDSVIREWSARASKPGHAMKVARQMCSVSALAGVVLLPALFLYLTGAAGSNDPSTTLARSSPDNAAAAPSGSPAPGAPAVKLTPTSVRFADWPYKKYAFQIYPGDLGGDAKKALAGFNLTVQDQGSSVVLMLKAASSRYRDAEYAIDKGDVAYFVETSMRDDPSGAENNLRDDGVIAVDSQGYILQS